MSRPFFHDRSGNLRPLDQKRKSGGQQAACRRRAELNLAPATKFRSGRDASLDLLSFYLFFTRPGGFHRRLSEYEDVRSAIRRAHRCSQSFVTTISNRRTARRSTRWCEKTSCLSSRRRRASSVITGS